MLSVLDGESLQRCFFNKLRDVCCEWQKQLPSLRPLTRFLLVSIHAIRNARRKMEDRHVLLPEFNQLFGLSVSLDTTGEADWAALQHCCKHGGLVMVMGDLLISCHKLFIVSALEQGLSDSDCWGPTTALIKK